MPSPLPDLVELRGRINLTVNGQPSRGSVYPYASRNRDSIDSYIGGLGFGNINVDGTWTYYVNPQKVQDRSAPLWFFVYPPFGLAGDEVILPYSVDWNTIVYDRTISPYYVITGIDLGSHHYSAVTVTCSGGYLAIDGAPPYTAGISGFRVRNGNENLLWMKLSDEVTGRQTPLNMGEFTFDAALPFKPGDMLRLQFSIFRNHHITPERKVHTLDLNPQEVFETLEVTWGAINLPFSMPD